MHPVHLVAAQFDLAAGALGDTPFTVLPAHALRRRTCRAYIAGQLPDFPALIVQRNDAADEPVAFGSDPGAIARLLPLVDGWTCIEVETTVAPALAEILARELARPMRLYDDLHFTLLEAVAPAPHVAVRLLTSADEALLAAAHPSLRPAARDDVAWLLREGICACAIVAGQVVARADCGAWSARYADIGVATLEAHRGQGYASAAAALVAVEIQRRGRTPVWSTGEDNWASQRVARKLGFREVGRMTYVIPVGLSASVDALAG